MSDEILRFYNNELHYLRRLGDEFSRTHSRIAGNLKIGSEGEYDPHVGRMVESFAYLTARIRSKLEDDFPEISSSMLEVLYPHFQRPLPAMGIVQFTLDSAQADRFDGETVTRRTAMESDPIEGEPCRFQTCYEVKCFPMRVGDATLKQMPVEAPKHAFGYQVQSVLRLDLNTFSPDVKFHQFAELKPTFYIKSQPPISYDIYEMLMNDVLGVAVVENLASKKVFRLDPKQCIRPVGFDADQGLIDYPPQSFIGYRLLTEFFGFPEKFLFFELDLESIRHQLDVAHVEVYLYLKKPYPDHHSHITADTFRLGCTPIVNLYKQRAEPIRLTHFDSEYPIVPDARRPLAHEVYSIDRVVATSEDHRQVEFHPFYSFKHGSRDTTGAFWHATRRPQDAVENVEDRGSEMHISFVDLDFSPAKAGKWTIDIDTTCFNRNRPHRLPFGGGEPRLQLEDAGAITELECLTLPSRTLRPALQHGTRWRLISQLSLNHISLTNGENGPEALREILRLYDMRDSDETRRMIEGLVSVVAESSIARVGHGPQGGICRGTDVQIMLDEDQFKSGGLFLFASVLEHFMGLYTTINSFTRTSVRTKQRDSEELRQWPPRTGEMVLL
ncbi:MAG: type VI secretion system protein ImpG [Pirellulaceae bacterium]|jgi:type VI secretion system protein ImpG